jgi:hypothetical protein
MIAAMYNSSAQATAAGLETQRIGKWIGNKVGLVDWIIGYTVALLFFLNPTYFLSGASCHTYVLAIIGY